MSVCLSLPPSLPPSLPLPPSLSLSQRPHLSLSPFLISCVLAFLHCVCMSINRHAQHMLHTWVCLRVGLSVDVNECETIPGVCRNGQCTNTEGSYFCTCSPGFEPTRDRTGCICEYAARSCKVCYGYIDVCIESTRLEDICGKG